MDRRQNALTPNQRLPDLTAQIARDVLAVWDEHTQQGYDFRHVQKALGAAAAACPNEVITPLVRRLLRDTNRRVWNAAAEVLGEIGSTYPVPDTAWQPFVTALQCDDNEDVRRKAARALEKLSTANQVPATFWETLAMALHRDSDKYVRWAAAVVLGQVGAWHRAPAITWETHLAALMKSTSGDGSRRAAAVALKEFLGANSTFIIIWETLLPNLMVTSPYSKWSLLRSVILNLYRDSRPVSKTHWKSLLTILQFDSDEDALWVVAEALEQVSTANPASATFWETLVTALQCVGDEHFHIQQFLLALRLDFGLLRCSSAEEDWEETAKALGQYSTANPVPITIWKTLLTDLLNCTIEDVSELEDVDEDVLWATAEALEKLSTANSVPTIIWEALLTVLLQLDPEPPSRPSWEVAAKALGQLGAASPVPAAVWEALVSALQPDSDTSAWWQVSEAVMQLSIANPVPAAVWEALATTLQKAVASDNIDPHSWKAATEVVVKLGAANSVPTSVWAALSAALWCDTASLDQKAAKALAQLSSSHPVPDTAWNTFANVLQAKPHEALRKAVARTVEESGVRIIRDKRTGSSPVTDSASGFHWHKLLNISLRQIGKKRGEGEPKWVVRTLSDLSR